MWTIKGLEIEGRRGGIFSERSQSPAKKRLERALTNDAGALSAIGPKEDYAKVQAETTRN